MARRHVRLCADDDGVRFLRGAFWGAVFSVPLWAFILWAAGVLTAGPL